jgi:hypothetical protein
VLKHDTVACNIVQIALQTASGFADDAGGAQIGVEWVGV